MISTRIIKIDPLRIPEKELAEAADILSSGGLVITPTETVYGIAADMLKEKTIERLFAIKERPKDKPFSLHIDKKESVEKFASAIPVSAYKLIDKFWPGPLTLILKAKDKGTIGVRMPDHEVALRLISLAEVPIVCPSANISGKPAPTDFTQAIADLGGLVDMAIDCGKTRLGKESTVVDLTGAALAVLREGAIRKEDIEEAAGKKTVLFVCTGNSCRSVMAKALLEKKLKEQGRSDDIEVLSAGLMMLGGLSAAEEVKELLKQEGMDVSRHRSQGVTGSMLKKSDLILVMEKMHEERILKIAPEVRNRLFLLKEFAKIKESSLDISDPIGRPMDFYVETFAVIKEAIDRVSQII